jgi:5'-3' exonuclease
MTGTPSWVLRSPYTTVIHLMGIKGLAGFLKWKLPKASRSWASGVREPQCWAIDCSCLMYRARGAGLSIVTVVAGLIVRLRQAGVTPVIVFDGRPPAAKADVIAARRIVREAAQSEITEIRTTIATTTNEVDRATLERRVTDLQQKAPQVNRDDKDDLKKMLYAAGILLVTATGEADDVLAYLCQHGHAQAVVSTDMDMLARGVPRLVIPETPDATVLSEITLVDVLTGLRLTYTQFVNACTLMGSDYTGSAWVGMKPPDAIHAAAATLPTDVSGASGLEEAARLLRGEGVVWEDIVSERQREKWSAGPPPKEPENLAALAGKLGWPREWISSLS